MKNIAKLSTRVGVIGIKLIFIVPDLK